MITVGELAQVEQTFPGLRYDAELSHRRGLTVLTGTLRPFADARNVYAVVSDLAAGKDVSFADNEIVPLNHETSQLEQKLREETKFSPQRMCREFEVEITYDGKAAPRCRLLHPRIPKEKQNHFWKDETICAFLASHWDVERDTLTEAIYLFLIWFIKWMVFDLLGVWIGSEHANDPAYHLDAIHRKAPCWCGKPKTYGMCCRPTDRSRLDERRIFCRQLLKHRRALMPMPW